MTSTNLNIVLTNAACCSATKALAVSKLLSIGSKCAYSEVLNLKLLNDYIEVLRCYIVDSETNCLTIDEFNIIVAKLMKMCDICECQLIQ